MHQEKKKNHSISLPILHQMTGMFMTKSKKRRRDKIYQCIKRKRRTIQSLYEEYGGMFSRAYWMDYDVFMSLHELLKPGIDKYVCKNNNSNNKECFYRHNGAIRSEICLAAALWYFAGGSYLDITISHGIGKTDVYHSVWAVVHATNNCTKLQFWFPTTVEECTELASEFTFRSKAGFDNCIGCIDGMLTWTEKPLSKECQNVGVDSSKFYCGRKGKFGLNLQGVCDAHRGFLYISVQHPASASDYLAFIISSLYQQLTQGSGLPTGYCLYGDNAYVNELYMSVPFPNTLSGPRDAYNYYHSQVQINIECAFVGALIQCRNLQFFQ